jgi:hypothetical protein
MAPQNVGRAKALEKKGIKMSFFDKAADCLLILFISFMIGFPTWCLYKHVTASGEINFCYQTSWKDELTLHGNIDWDHDLTIGVYKSQDELLEAAKKLNCRIGIRP